MVRVRLIVAALASAAIGCGDNSDSFEFVAVTFNTGTGPDLGHDSVPPDDGYTEADAEVTDMFYGNGLSWPAFIADTTAHLSELDADIVAFQEIFHSPDCAEIPQEQHPGFVCEMWQPGDPTVVQTVMGDGYQVACHLGKPDKCLAVRRSFATIRGCSDDLCLDGLAGAQVQGCGSGARIGRAELDLASGGAITVTTVHGSSGLSSSDQSCREAQFDQVFVDLDGAPAANGSANVVLGDLNTDPGRFGGSDTSADRFLDFVGDDKDFNFVSDVGPDAEATYLGLFNIDHIVSDRFTGACTASGVTEGTSPVTDALYFDHVPIRCELRGSSP